MALRREERILNLLSALLAARSPLSFADIRERVAGYDDDASPDAIEKRFDRDKIDLRAAGVPIEYVPDDTFGQAGYRIARDRFFLDEIRFTFEEGIVLAALSETAFAGAGDAFSASLRSALVKVSVDSPLSEAFRESVGEQQVLDARLPRRGREDAGRLSVLSEALAARRPVRFTYYTLGRGREGVRTVEPWGIGYFRGQWYLVGRDVKKRQERIFRTSRIRGDVEVLPPKDYRVPEDFDLRERLGRSPWELPGGEPTTVRVRFDASIAWMIEENVRSGQRFERGEAGGGVLELRATDPEALVRWVAQYGAAAEVLDPPEVREIMRRHLEAIVGRYGG